MTADIILGCLFGDEGKGMTTSYLCSQNNDENTVVVRFSGGQQAGHTVIKNGIKHIHSNFGSGTLNGVPSYFSEHCCVYPNTIVNELKTLKEKGFKPSLTVHPMTKITTPADIAYNRVTERKNRHGSCGMGVGTTLKRNNETPYKLTAIDTLYPALFQEKVKSIFRYYESKFEGDDLVYFYNVVSTEETIFNKNFNSVFEIKDYSYLNGFENIIFEGSQGIMLDMEHGVFPNVTYGNTTSKNAIEICEKLGIDEICVYYVTRCYQTRHGNGWMSNQDKITLQNTSNEINVKNEWQGKFKIGPMDYDLLNHSILIDKMYSPGCIRKLVVTCLDQRMNFDFEYSKLNHTFEPEEILESYSPDVEDFNDRPVVWA